MCPEEDRNAEKHEDGGVSLEPKVQGIRDKEGRAAG